MKINGYNLTGEKCSHTNDTREENNITMIIYTYLLPYHTIYFIQRSTCPKAFPLKHDEGKQYIKQF